MLTTEIISHLIKQALLAEIYLTPKPGLVDKANSGAHRDMDFALFLSSIDAITEPVSACFDMGFRTASLAPALTLMAIRSIGKTAETKMLAATGGINTHKGAIFSLGILCAAIGRCEAQNMPLTVSVICEESAKMCQGLVEQELAAVTKPRTAGERFFHQWQITGARGEAESGFRLVREVALPVYLRECSQYQNEECANQNYFAMVLALLNLMAVNADTNLVSRGGIEGMRCVQDYTQNLLCHPAVLHRNLDELVVQLNQFDQWMIERNLSPGGSADLLTVTYFLANWHKNGI